MKSIAFVLKTFYPPPILIFGKVRLPFGLSKGGKLSNFIYISSV